MTVMRLLHSVAVRNDSLFAVIASCMGLFSRVIASERSERGDPIKTGNKGCSGKTCSEAGCHAIAQLERGYGFVGH